MDMFLFKPTHFILWPPRICPYHDAKLSYSTWTKFKFFSEIRSSLKAIIALCRFKSLSMSNTMAQNVYYHSDMEEWSYNKEILDQIKTKIQKEKVLNLYLLLWDQIILCFHTNPTSGLVPCSVCSCPFPVAYQLWNHQNFGICNRNQASLPLLYMMPFHSFPCHMLLGLNWSLKEWRTML